MGDAGPFVRGLPLCERLTVLTTVALVLFGISYKEVSKLAKPDNLVIQIVFCVLM